MGVVPPKPGFLEGLRTLTDDNGALLIFDEVISGFRASPGGAQALYGVTPDLTCLGKIIGGGLPVGAYGGRKDIMQMMAPVGPVYQAGTLSGNPLAMTAGIETLKALGKPGVYEQLEKSGAMLEDGINQAAEESNVKIKTSRVGSVMTVFFSETAPVDFETATKADTALFGKFFGEMLKQGIYWPPSQFEAIFISTAHSEADIKATIEAVGESLKSL